MQEDEQLLSVHQSIACDGCDMFPIVGLLPELAGDGVALAGVAGHAVVNGRRLFFLRRLGLLRLFGSSLLLAHGKQLALAPRPVLRTPSPPAGGTAVGVVL